MHQKPKQYMMEDFGDSSFKEFQRNLNFSTQLYPLSLTQWKTVKTLRTGLDEIDWKPVLGLLEDLAACGNVSRTKLHESVVDVITKVLGSEYVNQVLRQFHSETVTAEMMLIESLIFSFVQELQDLSGDLISDNVESNSKPEKESNGNNNGTESSYLKATESFKRKQNSKWSHGSSQIYKRPQRRVKKIEDKVGKQIATLEKMTSKKGKYTISRKSTRSLIEKSVNDWCVIESETHVSTKYDKKIKVHADKSHEKNGLKNTELIKSENNLLKKIDCNVQEQPEKDVCKRVSVTTKCDLKSTLASEPVLSTNASMTPPSTSIVEKVSSKESSRLENSNSNQRERDLRDKTTETDFHYVEDSSNRLGLVQDVNTSGRYETNATENLVVFKVSQELADIIKLFLENPHDYIPLDCYSRNKNLIPSNEIERIRTESRMIIKKLDNITLLSVALLVFSVASTGTYFIPLISQMRSMAMDFISHILCEWCQ